MASPKKIRDKTTGVMLSLFNGSALSTSLSYLMSQITVSEIRLEANKIASIFSQLLDHVKTNFVPTVIAAISTNYELLCVEFFWSGDARISQWRTHLWPIFISSRYMSYFERSRLLADKPFWGIWLD